MMIVNSAFIMVVGVATWTIITTMASSLLLVERLSYYGHQSLMMMMLAATMIATKASSSDPQQILNADYDINNNNDDIMKVSTESASDTITTTEEERIEEEVEILQIPSFTDSFGKYPNPLNITNNDRILYFHPVIMKFPIVIDNIESSTTTTSLMKQQKKKTHIVRKYNNNDWYYEVSDYSENYTKLHHGINASIINLASELELHNIRSSHIVLKMIRHIQYGMIPRIKHHIAVLRYHINQKILHWFHRKDKNDIKRVHYLKEKLFKKEQQQLDKYIPKTATTTIPMKNDTAKTTRYVYYGIGRYDENRISLYQSQLFDNITYSINGYNGLRTIHIGIDLNGPLGTSVYSVCNGYIHSIGYNPQLGDYGYVIIIRHYYIRNNNGDNSDNSDNNYNNITFYALYGHLDERTTRQYRNRYEKYYKQFNASQNSLLLYIKKGQMIGKIGDIYENGGWKIPHVHFQVSMNEPMIIHDMPGAVSINDRNKALYEYFDPRYILGNIY